MKDKTSLKKILQKIEKKKQKKKRSKGKILFKKEKVSVRLSRQLKGNGPKSKQKLLNPFVKVFYAKMGLITWLRYSREFSRKGMIRRGKGVSKSLENFVRMK